MPPLPSGYSANVGIIAALMRGGDLIVTDQLSHASIVDGIALSKAKVRYFRHNDAEDLDGKLKDSEAASSSSSKGSIRWTATWPICPRSSRSQSETAPAS